MKAASNKQKIDRIRVQLQDRKIETMMKGEGGVEEGKTTTNNKQHVQSVKLTIAILSFTFPSLVQLYSFVHCAFFTAFLSTDR